MDMKKSLRDVIIIVLVIIIAILFFKTRKPGPAEQATPDPTQNGMNSGMDSDMQNQGMPPHGSLQYVLTDGDPIVHLGDFYVGREWYDEQVNSILPMIEQDGSAGEFALESAKVSALARACRELMYLKLAEDWGITVDQAEIDRRSQEFQADEASMQTMEQMGVSFNRLKERWETELRMPQLQAHVAGIMSMDPTLPAAEQAFNQFIDTKVLEGGFVFDDDEMAELYNVYVSAMTTEDPTVNPHGEGEMGMSNPHAGMDMGTGSAVESESGTIN